MSFRALFVWCFVSLVGFSARADTDLLEAARAAAAERGAKAPSLITREGELESGKTLRTHVTLPAGTCVVTALRLADGDARLRLRPHAGDVLSDRDTGPLAWVRYCAGATAEKLGIVAEGSGPFALGVFPVVANAPAPTAPRPDPVPETLEVRLATERAGLGRDFVAMAPARDEDLSARDPRRREVVLDAGRCYRVLAVADAAVGVMRVGFEGVAATERAGSLATPSLCVDRTAPRALHLAVSGSGVCFGSWSPRTIPRAPSWWAGRATTSWRAACASSTHGSGTRRPPARRWCAA